MCFSSPDVNLEYQEERDKMHGLPACNAIGYAPDIRALVVVLTQRNLEQWPTFSSSQRKDKNLLFGKVKGRGNA